MTPPTSCFRFLLLDQGRYWTWTLARSRGRGRRRAELPTSRAFATEAECRADIERVRAEIAGAKVGRKRGH